jgi:hypothetical protein
MSARQPPMPDKVCLVSTIRSPVIETIYFVNYHLNIGIDEVILFFDDPDDEAFALLQDYASVRLIRCDSNYWKAQGISRPATIEDRQECNANVGLRIAAENGFQWIIHIDSDELIVPKYQLKTALSMSSADVLRFTIKEAVSERDHYDNIFQATLFKERAKDEKRLRRRLAMLFGCGRAFFEGEYFRSHAASKAAVRVSPKITHLKLHGPKLAKPETITETQTTLVTLLHYDCVGIDAWKTKWRRRIDGSATAVRIRPARQKQLDLFKEAYGNANDEIALYASLHKISKYQQLVLRILGLLTVIKLKDELFLRPKG